MGSPCEIISWARSEQEAQHWFALARAEVERIEQKYSRYRQDSVLSRINAGAGGGDMVVDEETASLLNYANTCFDASGGAFDITSGVLRRLWQFGEKNSRFAPQVPSPHALATVLQHIGWQRVNWQPPTLSLPAHMELDFGGVAKEYAADRAAMVCAQAGACALLINLGGDVRALASQPGDVPWRVGITHPRPRTTGSGDATLATLDVLHGGVATSGDYERYIEINGKRYCHILDPRTGMPAEDAPQAVSVAAPACMVAGSLTTMAMLAGKGAQALLDTSGLSYLLVTADGSVVRV